jgi:hypothetical protein
LSAMAGNHEARKLVVRGLAASTTQQSVEDRLRSAHSFSKLRQDEIPWIMWFEGGSAADLSIGQSSKPSWCTVVAPSKRAEDVIVASFDGLSVDGSTAIVEVSPNQQLTLLEDNRGLRGEAQDDGECGTYEQDDDFVAFIASRSQNSAQMAELDVTKGKPGVTDELTAWVERRTEETSQQKVKPTALVDAVIGNWFYGHAFPWEKKSTDAAAAAAEVKPGTKSKRKQKRKCLRLGERNTSSDDDEQTKTQAAEASAARAEAASRRRLRQVATRGTVEDRILRKTEVQAAKERRKEKKQAKAKRTAEQIERRKEAKEEKKRRKEAAKGRAASLPVPASKLKAKDKELFPELTPSAPQSSSKPVEQGSPISKAPQAASSSFTVSSARDTPATRKLATRSTGGHHDPEAAIPAKDHRPPAPKFAKRQTPGS